MPEHFSTMWLDRENGVLAIMGKPKDQPELQRTQAIYFSQEKLWDQNKIHDWLQLHPSYLTPVSTTKSPSSSPVSESLIKKPVEPTIPVSQAVKLIEQVLPIPSGSTELEPWTPTHVPRAKQGTSETSQHAGQSHS